MLFSQRKGLRPATKLLQVESIDSELKNALWSCLHELYLKTYEGVPNYPYSPAPRVQGSNMETFFGLIWLSYFKQPTDTMPNDIDEVIGIVRKHFFEGKWHDVYDFMEFVLQVAPATAQQKLSTGWNTMLQRENAGYRIVDRRIVEITNDAELSEIEKAVTSSTEGAQAHLRAAVSLLADRKTPDYRNSIKESISAVESICRALTGNSGATLGAALNVLQSKLKMHGALKSALSSLYGYTSDEHGIRHAMLEEPNLTAAEAKFMLVACSAFTNYLITKAAEARLKL
ncbi:MAG TPA: hypothetical protein VHW01_06475 [Polyangiaceae bacterium]|jgi:hypothetical protein|nr:hypothetical protein [Polyangiaceae bacterium]